MTATEPCCGYPNSTHYMGCACREADFAAKLVAADHCRASADRALYAERCRVVDLEAKLATLQRENQMLWTAIANRDEVAPPPSAAPEVPK